jgi:hypothetical protein
MKTIFNSPTPKFLSLSVIVFATLLFAFSSCKKSDNTVDSAAYVMATNSAETSDPLDFYLDNAKANTSALAYTNSTAYIAVSAGNHQVQFKSSSTSSINTSTTAAFSSGQFYSVFYTDDQSVVTTQDDRTPPQSGKARVRFINLSAIVSSNVDFAINGGARLVSGLAYKVASAYNDVDPAASYSLYLSGSSTVLLNIPANLQAGHIYTIYISGATNVTVGFHVVQQS